MVNWLDLYERVAVLPFFNLTLAHNTGAAFSFLAGAGGWQRWFFVLLAVVISTVLVIWMKRLAATARVEAISLALIIGGAIGNVIDRLSHKYFNILDLRQTAGFRHDQRRFQRSGRINPDARHGCPHQEFDASSVHSGHAHCAEQAPRCRY